MHIHHQNLVKADLLQLRPTQITVGYAEVQAKRAAWARMAKPDRKRFLNSHWFPAVRGPSNNFYVVDHHHLGLALVQEGVTQGFVVQLNDFSQLNKDEFWTLMEHHQWVHPYDGEGKRLSPAALPKSLDGLADDPYRSLAGAVRNAGGFPKDQTPFAEFLWADFFRRRIKPAKLQREPDGALGAALELCHSKAAAHLPGWSGRATLSR